MHVDRTPDELERRRARAERFARLNPGDVHANATASTPARESLAAAGPVVGTCQALEKAFLRLTAAPSPAMVRPPRVLQQSFAHVRRRWSQSRSYAHACEQLRSIRQDLTVQNVSNNLAAAVFAYHARLSLEPGPAGGPDLDSLNQCLTGLRPLHAARVFAAQYDVAWRIMERAPLPGRRCHVASARLIRARVDEERAEFAAYELLYRMVRGDTSGLAVSVSAILSDPCLGTQPAYSHALAVARAFATDNYHQYFQLCKGAPNFNGQLMAAGMGRMRRQAVLRVRASYRPRLDIGFLAHELGMDNEEHCAEFLREVGEQLSADARYLQTTTPRGTKRRRADEDRDDVPATDPGGDDVDGSSAGQLPPADSVAQGAAEGSKEGGKRRKKKEKKKNNNKGRKSKE